MDVIQLLKADHQRIDELFGRLAGLTSRQAASRRRGFAELADALTVHSAAEEEILYPQLAVLRSLRPAALKSMEEHRLLARLLEELAELDVTDEVWDAKMKVLRDLLQHHVREEEGEVFRALRLQLGRDELATLGEDITAFKQSLELSEMPATTRTRAGRRRAAAYARPRTSGSSADVGSSQL